MCTLRIGQKQPCLVKVAGCMRMRRSRIALRNTTCTRPSGKLFLTILVASRCFPYGIQRMCTQVQPTLIPFQYTIRPVKVNFLSFRQL